MSEKHEWRKKEKALYLPKAKPEVIDIPSCKFLMIKGEGNPEEQMFSDCISALYSVSYAIKMTLKKATPHPKGYMDYTVYPLEGVWSLNKKAIKEFDGTINKKDFIYTLMIRQPDFVSEAFFKDMLALTKKKASNELLDTLTFESETEGRCIQMLHVGPYDDEPASFAIMEDFARDQGQKRLSKAHREIYLSDFRKVAPEKLKTVLRFKVK